MSECEVTIFVKMIEQQCYILIVIEAKEPLCQREIESRHNGRSRDRSEWMAEDEQPWGCSKTVLISIMLC